MQSAAIYGQYHFVLTRKKDNDHDISKQLEFG